LSSGGEAPLVRLSGHDWSGSMGLPLNEGFWNLPTSSLPSTRLCPGGSGWAQLSGGVPPLSCFYVAGQFISFVREGWRLLLFPGSLVRPRLDPYFCGA
jgi:hypothetical protein